MSGLRFYLFLAAFCSCSLLGRGNEAKPSVLDLLKPVQGLGADTVVLPVTKVPTTEATTLTPEATTETTQKPTEPPATTPKPPAPTTQPPAPTTQPPAPTTQPPAPTTQPPAPTPPPKPQPLPAPDQGTWSYTAPDTNITCIVAQFAAQINVTYTRTVNNVTSLRSVIMNVPVNASVLDGNCNASAIEQWMTIGWASDVRNSTAGPYHTISLQFLKNMTTKNYALKNFTLTIDGSVLVNMSYPLETLEFFYGEEWATPLATSYRCQPATKLSMSNDTYSVNTAVVTISRLQEEAFKTTPGTGFSAARECGGGDVPDAVPIAVGCALGGLVVVVLVAYLFARRRSAARGYLSM